VLKAGVNENEPVAFWRGLFVFLTFRNIWFKKIKFKKRGYKKK